MDFSNSDTLVDYLLPPNPNAQFTSLNFQDPSANLQNIDSFFDVTPTSSSNNINTFQSVSNQFSPSAPSFQNPINIPSLSPTQGAGSDQVQSVSFQSAPLHPSQTFSSPAQPSVNQFIQNKESNPFSRELNNANQFKPPNQFRSNNNIVKSDPITLEQSNQGKWDLGFDANDILAPPNLETGRANEYDTINGNRFKKTNIQPPILNNNLEPSSVSPPNNFQPQNNFQSPNQFNPINNQFEPPVNQFSQPQPTNQFPQPQPTNQFQQPQPTNQFSQPQPTNQFPQPQPTNQFPQSNNQFFSNQFPPQNNFNQFNQALTNQIPNNQFVPPNQHFTQQNPAPAANNQIPVPSQFSSNNEQTDVVWGTQKQIASFNPTTAAPFLPTIPPNNNAQTSTNFHNNFNNQNLQQFPSTQLNSDQIYQLPNHQNQHNYPLDTPLTSQFDSFLPQGTVSDHSFFPVNENVRHFQHKRQVDEEEEENEEEFEEPAHHESESKFKAGPVYSYVKTDRNGHFKWSVRHPSRR